MNLEAWGDENDTGVDGYVTEEYYEELQMAHNEAIALLQALKRSLTAHGDLKDMPILAQTEEWLSKNTPTDSAWAYFQKHLADISVVIARFGDGGDVAKFDEAVEAVDTDALEMLMKRAWLNAPDSRKVYSIPGFTEMCNLLDATVPGFFEGSEGDGDSDADNDDL